MIYDSDCGWCPSGPCSAEGKHRCEAESVLEASNVEDYETCYEGMKMDSFFSDNTLKYFDILFKLVASILFLQILLILRPENQKKEQVGYFNHLT